ncbi:MAG: serine/threonine protein kinase [Chitinophagaceae bacterium]|nr:MAG: serine/threonine protein kinase [Chitinophagaceae bacterium]
MIGQQIQNYLITSHLGEGGMGVVYKANDEVLGRDVALKMLHTPLVNQSQFLERFKKEARILARLLHPNIAVIYNFIEQDSRHFMVMEYVEGDNLDQLLRQKNKLPHELIVQVLIQALEGLHHAHKKDICHRDIKPSNLILTPDGIVKLMDFGIAKIAGEQRLTQVARVVGTLEYMAPELIEGKDASVATDIYALAVTAYELLTGKLPFGGSTDFNVMQDILKKAPLSPDKLDGSIPKALSDIIVKALRKKPADRFTTATEFQSALKKEFPAITGINVWALKNEAPATRLIETAGSMRIEVAETMLHEVSGRQSKSLLEDIKKIIAGYPPAQLFLAAAVLITMAVVAFTIGGTPETLTAEKANVVKTPALPSLTKRVAVDEIDAIPTRMVSNIPLKTNDDDQVKAESPEDKKKKLPAGQSQKKEKGISKDKAPAVQKNSDSEPLQLTEKPTSTPGSVKKEKYVYINGKLKVVVTLNANIDPDNVREGQTLDFSVLKPVLHDGETIIAAGARAQGVITQMNKRKLVLVLTNVQAVNGEKILFEEDELAGKPDRVLSRRHFTGIIRKGLSLVL